MNDIDGRELQAACQARIYVLEMQIDTATDEPALQFTVDVNFSLAVE
jgi:hypothetical protein